VFCIGLETWIAARVLTVFSNNFRLRTIQKYMKDLGVLTTQRNGLTKDQEDKVVDLIAQDDPLQQWGGRLIQEKLSRKSIHITRSVLYSHPSNLCISTHNLKTIVIVSWPCARHRTLRQSLLVIHGPVKFITMDSGLLAQMKNGVWMGTRKSSDPWVLRSGV